MPPTNVTRATPDARFPRRRQESRRDLPKSNRKQIVTGRRLIAPKDFCYLLSSSREHIGDNCCVRAFNAFCRKHRLIQMFVIAAKTPKTCFFKKERTHRNTLLQVTGCYMMYIVGPKANSFHAKYTCTLCYERNLK